MKQNALILSSRYSIDSQVLYKTALSRNWKVWRFINREIPDWLYDCNSSIYCETAYAEYLASELFITLLSPDDSLLTKLPFEFVKRNINFVPYKDFRMPKVKKFIKPADYKYFPAGIYNDSDIVPGLTYSQENDPILISDVVSFNDEYRLFVMGNNIVTGSIYVKDKKFVGDQATNLVLDQNIISFGRDVAKAIDKLTPFVYVLDVGLLDTGKYAVIEFNPVWASGIYNSDPILVLECLQSACLSNKE